MGEILGITCFTYEGGNVFMKSEMKRKGFTLVELLIVIVVIGILSAMMMLSSTEATTSARASNIVSNLRNLKTAALAYYTDHLDDYNSSLKLNNVDMKDLVKYLKAGGNVSTSGLDKEFEGYVFVNGTGNYEVWFVGYTGASDTRIRDKLKGRASSVQLLSSPTVPTTTSGGKASNAYDGTTSTVYMIVLGGSEATTSTPSSNS